MLNIVSRETSSDNQRKAQMSGFALERRNGGADSETARCAKRNLGGVAEHAHSADVSRETKRQDTCKKRSSLLYCEHKNNRGE